ncbi:MAG TPA: porin [Flavitalea sp.]|nr:porin [Flavitalea sp.]
MNTKLPVYPVFCIVLACFLQLPVKAQFLMDMIDTSNAAEKGLWAIYKKDDHLQISAYFQPQFQVAQQKGVDHYSGGDDFSRYSNNRFLLRRARLRADYAHFNASGQPQAQVVMQIDGTERGVVIRDMWARFYENEWELLSFTGGVFARPFGYEVNLSSSDRETPERGRMSQILMKTERDLGVMASFEPRKKDHPLRFMKIAVGVFNGQGLTGPQEYDSYKDIVGRISLNPYPLTPKVKISAGLSVLQGGIAQNSKYLYSGGAMVNGHEAFRVDSSESNIGKKAPRKYYGADAQLSVRNPWGRTQLRGEYWMGTQTGSARHSETPGFLLDEPYYVRDFNGGFFYLLQDIVNEKHQLVVKYDWYDPNTELQGREIGMPDTHTHWGDIKFETIGLGYNHYFNKNIKLMLWYDWVTNEHTQLEGYTADLKDNILTCRVQFRF